MDAAFLRKTFALIAKGLVEKEIALQKEPTRYPYSKTLQHGINMFLAASYHAGCIDDTNLFTDETSFLSRFITKPIPEWFVNWPTDVIDQLSIQEESFFAYDGFAYQRGEHVYSPSSECYEYLDSQESDIMDGTDERILYEKMKLLSQEKYNKLRRYIIENQIISLEERRLMSLELADDPIARECFQFSYEELVEDCYRCPCCGWTMVRGKYGYICHSVHCTDTIPKLTDAMKIDASNGNWYRLKKGVMRYFSAPGKLELEIDAYCEKKKIVHHLWPHQDLYDIEIQFADGEVWEIDAKAYRNPIALRSKIQNDNGFPRGNYARGYFVVPTEFTRNQQNYTTIVNQSLTAQPNVKCVTLRTLKSEITKKEAACNGK